MKTKYLFDPIVMFLVPSVFAVLTWILTPQQWFNDWRILYKVDADYIYLPWAIALLPFGVGYLIRRVTYAPPAEKALPLPSNAVTMQWVTFLVASLSMLALAYLVVSTSGISGLFQTYTVRGSYLGGVTTFSLLTNAGLTIAGVYFLMDRSLKRVSVVPLMGLGVYALYRGFVGAERIAIFIPFLAIAAAYTLMRFERVTMRMVVYFILGVMVILLLFIGAEYSRSFTAKLAYGENISTNIFEYGAQRFLLYFSTSVNSGGVEYSFFKTNVSQNLLFTTTCAPLAKLLYGIFGMTPFGLDAYTGDTADLAVSMGLYNPEFNNHWGVVTPFTEGWVPGCIFWFVWGFWGTHLYLNVTRRRGDAWDWALYGLFVAAFVDNQSRVALLAAPHFLIPFGWLYFLRLFQPRGGLLREHTDGITKQRSGPRHQESMGNPAKAGLR
jgi:hypothetical protein